MPTFFKVCPEKSIPSWQCLQLLSDFWLGSITMIILVLKQMANEGPLASFSNKKKSLVDDWWWFSTVANQKVFLTCLKKKAGAIPCWQWETGEAQGSTTVTQKEHTLWDLINFYQLFFLTRTERVYDRMFVQPPIASGPFRFLLLRRSNSFSAGSADSHLCATGDGLSGWKIPPKL